MPKYQSKLDVANAVRSPYPVLTLVGSQVIATVMGDGSDTTYGKASSSAYPHDYCAGYYTYWGSLFAAGERCVSVCPYVRSKQPGTKTTRAVLTYYYTTQPGYVWHVVEGAGLSLPVGVSTITNYELPAYQGQQLTPLGTEWVWVQNTYPGLAFYDPHTADANRTLTYESGVYYYCTKRPACAAPTAPTGTVTATTKPAITFVLSSVIESWQVPAGQDLFFCGLTVQYDIYAGTLTTPGATPLASWQETATISNYIDSVTASTLTINTTPPVDLPNGALTIFVKAVRAHPMGTYPATYWSTGGGAYAYKQWTQTVALPGDPTVTATLDDANQAIYPTVNAPVTSGYDSATYLVDVQRQIAAGTWRDVRGKTGRSVTPGSNFALGNDYECARGVTNTYRVRVSAWHTVDAVRRYSNWVTATSSGPTAGTWNLKAVETTGTNWLGVPITEKPSESSQASASVLEPLGRDRPVVLLSTIGGFGGSLEVACKGATAIAAAKALEAYRGTVYLEDAFGEVRWIAITKVAWDRTGTAADPRRVVTFDYTEVSSGLSTWPT